MFGLFNTIRRICLLLSLISIGESQRTRSPQLIYQFSNDTFVDIENIAVRPNGHLLLSLISQPSIYSLNPNNPTPKPRCLYTFPGATSLTGIAELYPDVFAVVVGNYTVAKYRGQAGSFSIWMVDLKHRWPIARKVVSISEAQALNGMTAMEGSPGIALVADSALGAIFSVNTSSSSYHQVIQSPSMEPSAKFPLGVNGIHEHNKTLYFTNSALGTFCSIPITANGTAAGNVSILTHLPGGVAYDDFAIDSNGTAWIANHPNALDKVTSSGQQTTIVNITALVQPTAAAFGVGAQSCTLYVVTAGHSTNATITSGQVFAVDTC